MKRRKSVNVKTQTPTAIQPDTDNVVYQNKDVASKVTGEALLGHSLAPFGLPHIKIVKLLPTNLPAIEADELRLDNLFLLDDQAVAIIDYESAYSRKNFVKYLNYAARVVKRYADQNQLPKLKTLRIIVIYTADVEHASTEYDLKGVLVRIEPSYLVSMDTETIRKRLEEKIRRKESLSKEEQMQLMILPLTVKGKEEKQKVTMETVKLAKRIEDRTQKNQVLAGLLTFTDKIIDESCRERIKEEWKMTQIGKMIFDDGFHDGFNDGFHDGFEKGELQGQKQGEKRGGDQKLAEQICRKLRKGKTPETIAMELEEDLEIVKGICQAASGFAPDYDWGAVYEVWSVPFGTTTP